MLGDLSRGTVRGVMTRARAKGNIDTWEERGDHVKQGWSIARKLCDFYYKVHVERLLIMQMQFFVVIEGFSLRQMDVDLAPVSVTAAIETLLEPAFGERWTDPMYVKQTPSGAKSFCSDDMLKRWDLFRGRSPHERDSLRHAAKRLDALL